VEDKIIGFVLGCLLMGLVLGIYAGGLKAELSSAQKEAQNQQMYSQHQDQGQLQQMTQQRDACQSKFSRATILYVQKKNVFGTPFGDAVKSWALPVDIEPIYAGPEVGLFSHYDPKTQVETVKFQAKR
jgi:hypothetical protein